MRELFDVIDLKVNADFTLDLLFENNEKRIFDMKPYFEKPPFHKIAKLEIFKRAKIEFGTVVWPGNIDIDPEILYNQQR